MSILNSPFDQFQRYYTVKKLISKMTNNEKVKVLEVGANAHCNLREFLPHADITFTDIEDQAVPDNVKFIRADATNLPFDNEEFDFVVSTDVLEHVPSDLRSKFITECYRVSKKAFILACPIDNGFTPKAEQLVNETYKKLCGTDFRWLQEHIEQGLPTVEFINKVIESNSIKFTRFEHGRLDWWESLMKMHFIKEAESDYTLPCNQMDEYYNRFLYEKDFGEICYRSFWVLGIDTLADDLFSGHTAIDEKTSLLLDEYKNICNATENVCYRSRQEKKEIERTLSKQLEDCKKELSDRDNELSELRVFTHTIINSTSWKITKPIRFIRRIVSLLTKSVRFLYNNPSSIKSTYRKSYDLYKAVGLKEFISIVNNKLSLVNGSANPTIGSEGFDRNDYDEWIRRYDTRTESDISNMLVRIDGFRKKPCISIVMPTYKPNPLWLKEAIESVRQQVYENWQLCIADDCSNDPQISQILERYSKLDNRIKVVFREDNGHISRASNDALSLCTGEWIALLDHDDLLANNALYEVVKKINNYPDSGLIYSDEDKVDEYGNRKSPYFKPDWNRELLYSHNVICHLGVYRKDLLEAIGGFRVGYEGAQDLDLALRVVELLDDSQVVHIPKVLYHWRIHSGSTASTSDDAKPYAMIAGERALNDHFKRIGSTARSELTGSGFRTHYSLGDTEPLVSIIVPTRNGYSFTKQCIDSLLSKTSYTNYEILLVDNGSDDTQALEYFEQLKSNDKIKVIRDDGEFNYSRINNEAVEKASGEYVVLLNNDVEVITPNWLYEMVTNVIRDDVGIVGAKLLYPDNTVQHSGVILGIGGWAGHAHKGLHTNLPGYSGRNILASEFSAVTAACLIIEKALFEKVGGLNQVDLKVACNDVDLCLKVSEAGYRIVWTPYAVLYHHESKTRGYEDTAEKVARFESELSYMKNRWGNILENDPQYSPNLTVHHEDFSLAWPPRVDRF